MMATCRSRDDYTVGWICALPLEMAAAKIMLDEIHDDLPVPPTDFNNYILGRIKEHNVVIACLPSGDYGLVSANTVALQLLSSFRSIRFGLLVGIGGGIPNDEADIRLGDVVVSKPSGMYGGVVQYDYGKAMSGGEFKRTGTLNRPPQILLTALSKIQTNHLTDGAGFVAMIEQKFPQQAPDFARPAMEDHLFFPDCHHRDAKSKSCTLCDITQTVSRPARGDNRPLVHYGLIASANQLVRDSELRNRLGHDLGAYCVEMEAAGLMNTYPCLVIRGICDYADSHKNDEWHGYASAVAAAYAKELLLCIPVSDIRSAEDAVSRFNVPLDITGVSAIENFLGRQKELEHLWDHLQPQNSRKVAILHGLGGIGKTQLAIRFAREHKGHFDAALWLDGKSREALLQSLNSILPRLPGQFQITENAVEQNARQVLQWLAIPGNSRWLLIFDNVDQYQPGSGYDIKKFFPAADHGSILITSRLQSITELGRSFPVPTFNSKDAMSLLRESSQLISLDTASTDKVDQGTYIMFMNLVAALMSVDALTLIDRLGGLPLAIVIAGAFMRETGTSVSEYLQHYQESWHKLQLNAKPGRHYPQGNILQTWLVSYDEIRKRDPNIAELLLLLAHFDNRDIWFELVKSCEHSPNQPLWFRDILSDRLVFKEKMRTLIEFSLIDVNQQTSSYAMHPVVQEWCLDKAGLGSEWDELAFIAVGYMVPNREERDYWQLQRRLLVHADFVRQVLKSDRLIHNPVVWSSFDSFGNLYKGQGKLKQAEIMYQRALTGYERDPHLSTLCTLDSLGTIYHSQGKLKEAEAIYQQALKGYEKAPDLTNASNTINNLGNLYKDQGQWERAKAMYQQALKDRENILGPDHLDTLSTVNNLGTLYHTQGKLKEAEMMYQHAYTGTQKILGPDHTFTLNTMNNLGDVYYSQGKLNDAEIMYHRAFTGHEKTLGPDHLYTLNPMSNLGRVYHSQGKLKEAETLYQQALTGYTNALPSDHLSISTAIGNLGNVYYSQGKLEDAETMYRQAFTGTEKAVGPDHIYTLVSIHSLANLYHSQGRLKEAETMYRRVLEGREKALGEDHIDTLWITRDLANLYCHPQVGKQKEAKTLYQRALIGHEKILGPDDGRTKYIAESLRQLDRKRGNKIATLFHRK